MSSKDVPTDSKYAILGATAAGVALTLAGVALFSKVKENRVQAHHDSQIRIRQREILEANERNLFMRDQELAMAKASSKKQKKTHSGARRVKLYFNENDEMIEKAEDVTSDNDEETDLLAGKSMTVEDIKRCLKEKKRRTAAAGKKSKLIVNLGREEFDEGAEKITRDIFDGSSKTKNAEIFIDNLIKTKKKYIQTQQKSEDGEAEVGNPNFSKPIEATLKENNVKAIDDDTGAVQCLAPKQKKLADYQEKQKETDQLIMKMEPEKFDKKDHIFMNFFAMYGKNFINEKRSEGDDSHTSGNAHRMKADVRLKNGQPKALSC